MGAMASTPVPVLVITGAVGAGKSTVGSAAAALLHDAGMPHALVDLEQIERCWPVPDDDPWNERIIHKNLAAVWANFAEAGAHPLIVCRVLEARSLLEQIRVAVPGADITVVRLHVPPAELHARIRHREEGDPTWYLEAATYLPPVLERAGVEDHAVTKAGWNGRGRAGRARWRGSHWARNSICPSQASALSGHPCDSVTTGPSPQSL
jgi:adenylylsulfate kinase